MAVPLSEPAKQYREPTIADLQARLARIMAKRPAHICGAHWLQVCEGAERVSVESCACRPRKEPTTLNEARSSGSASEVRPAT